MLYKITLVALFLVTMGRAAPNTCRDSAACCTTIDFEWFDWPAQTASNPFVPLGGVAKPPWWDQGIRFSVDQLQTSTGLPYPLGLFNVSNLALANQVGNIAKLQGSTSSTDQLVLSPFYYTPITPNKPVDLLSGSKTLHMWLSRPNGACVSHVRTLRSLGNVFDDRMSLTLSLWRRVNASDPSSPMQTTYAYSTTTLSSNTYFRLDNDYELNPLQIDELRLVFFGKGWGAVASVEVCYQAPYGYDECGVCGGSGATCTGQPGASCDTGMGGVCSPGIVSDELICVPNLSNNIEVCNGLDDNCNGQVDEGDWGVVSCGVGACYREYSQCLNGMPNSRCVPNAPGPVEICGNGIDDNCNGLVDEGCASPSAPPTPSSSRIPQVPSQSATGTPSQTPSPSMTPSASPIPRTGQAYLIPILRCVTQLDQAASSVWQATFTYVYMGNQPSIALPVSADQNWVSFSSGVGPLGGNAGQPAVFYPTESPDQPVLGFQVMFDQSQEVQWTLQSNQSALSSLGFRQVAVANRYSPQCGSDGLALMPLEPIQPLLDGCVVQKSGSQCTLSAGYYNPNARSVQLDVSALGNGLNEFVAFAAGAQLPASQQVADRRQPRVFWPGIVQQAAQINFDCSQNLWALEWRLTVLGATKTLRVDQSSVC